MQNIERQDMRTRVSFSIYQSPEQKSERILAGRRGFFQSHFETIRLADFLVLRHFATLSVSSHNVSLSLLSISSSLFSRLLFFLLFHLILSSLEIERKREESEESGRGGRERERTKKQGSHVHQKFADSNHLILPI